ncbi:MULTISPECIES: ABC transporter ATP-binding protein [unclassified Mameliella]|uniref:ABC transporter ATP-binding protein n=1 Tax=unclassified Mameliella TaxID=2630630 RepID=UPI0027400E68|nr:MULTISPECIES: ABC transporter ATP-binding protein [unclassified Mameliella]
MTQPVLDVQGLRVEFPTRHGTLTAVDDISLTIGRGEILGVVGESGAGKSMTGMAILGLLEPPGRIAAGKILLSGDRIDTLTEQQLQAVRGRRIGAIFQDPLTSLNPLFKVGDQLVETIRLHTPMTRAQARARAIELMQEVGIPAVEERIDNYPHQFSGGMRQRIVIALALCAEPELIIADEPTTALDVSIQAQITALLKRLCRERGTAVMLVTHDMGVIAETADRVAVMYAGRLAELGTVENVVRRPQHPYTVGLMGSIPSLRRDETELQMIPGAMPRLNSIPPGCAFNPRCAQAGPKCSRDIPRIHGEGAACWLALEGATA